MTAEFILANEPVIRFACFAAVLSVVSALETVRPRRPSGLSRRVRWPNNLGLAVLNTLVARLLVPAGVVGLAAVAEARQWGLFNQPEMGVLPFWPTVVLGVMLLDLAIYLQHVLFHAVPALWRLHRVHHADPDFDVTTGVRFHPLEVLLSAGLKLAAVMALGIPVLAVLVFEVLLNATSLFNHANLHLPAQLDRVLRWVVVTPDMHRVHHSVRPEETNRNFGFNLPWWDRMLGSYRADPLDGHERMTIGIDQFRAPGEHRLDRLLTQPFRGATGRYSLGAGSPG